MKFIENKFYNNNASPSDKLNFLIKTVIFFVSIYKLVIHSKYTVHYRVKIKFQVIGSKQNTKQNTV